MEREELTTDKVIKLPIMALRGVIVFPKMFLHFDAKRTASVEALNTAMKEKQLLFVVAQKDASQEMIEFGADTNAVGTVVKVKQIVKLPGNVSRVLVEGRFRGEAIRYEEDGKHYNALIKLIDGTGPKSDITTRQALVAMVNDLLKEYQEMNTKISKETLDSLRNIKDISLLADSLTTHLIKPIESKQRILEEIDPVIRLQLVIRILNNEIEIARIQQEMHNKVKSNIDKNQREYYLREQMKVIQNELGESVDINEEVDEYMGQLDALDAPESVKEKIEKEIKRLKRMNMSSSEGAVIRNYLDCMLEMPWNVTDEEAIDLKHAEEVLDHDHYGLQKVKERVLEHLAVRKMVDASSAPIICLVGPPGTGKTSIARSIADSLHRQYMRISLGGVRDEAEIRGHRRTYIGAMPGRLVNGLRQVGTSNPLILLDEIDKMSQDFKGDPSSALLEVLDAEQNHQFRDHYLEVPVDLSKVLFVATANSLRTISRPLLDRLEVIEVAGYTENEKYHIATEHLFPKQLSKHGLTKKTLQITEEGMTRIINEYTREAGVRQLERRIGEVCRKAAKTLLMENRKRIRVTDKNIEEILGIPKYTYDKMDEQAEVGVVRGLAWTEMGGDTLSIEVVAMPGSGKFKITGRIGDVMQESASAAMSYIRSKSEELKIEIKSDEVDIHIHVPEGAVPKDGPSAGITLATAMVSALSNRKVRNDIAMTGEITLRGRVLPIGGVKEKLLAAKRAGIFEVIVPVDNKRHISELDKEILEGMKIHYASSLDQVLELTLMDE